MYAGYFKMHIILPTLYLYFFFVLQELLDTLPKTLNSAKTLLS